MRIAALAFVASLCLAASALGQDRTVSQSTLKGMGLERMHPLSDRDAHAVRGKGSFANVWGGSVANWGLQSSTNNYAAGSSWLGRGSAAGGNSLSFGGNFQFSRFAW